MNKLKQIIPKFAGKKVLVVGDLMLDEHIWSSVKRISPEAPVPVAEVKQITHVAGGCGNVASNIKSLSGIPLLIGIIGADSSGQRLVKYLKNQKIATNYLVKTVERPTILKSRIIAGSQQVIRVDREETVTVSEKLERAVLKKIRSSIRNADAVVLSDYNKGVLTYKICSETIRLAKKHKIPVAVDPKGYNYKKYRCATVITPNLVEAEHLSGKKSVINAGKTMLRQTGARNILITRGKDGMSLYPRSGKSYNIPAIPREVFDITGAGDTVIAALSLALSTGANMPEAASLGNYAAAVAVSKVGTQPVYKDELEEAIELENEPLGRKIKARSEITKIIKRLKIQGKKIVFTNGCFDILHLGHVRYLREAKKLGDALIVGLNSDSSVRKLKGNKRPLVTEMERAEVVASLECVDYISIFSELRPDNLIRIVKPNIHVKGGDYKFTDLPEAALIRSLGGKIVIIPPVKGRSTTNIVDKIRKGF
ncbi:D-glycero-beta-D-manno-heptose-7-phosphate kinase [Candidatus Margulisiibacteriota bacterium]